MDMTDEEKAERLERQKKELELRAKKRNSRLFLFFGSIFEIVETLAVILLLIIFFTLMVFRVFKLPETAAGTVYQFCLIVSVIGGIFLGFMIYKNCANFVIEKFNLSDKLSNEILGHYSKRFRNSEKEALKK
jgi:amino acid permease